MLPAMSIATFIFLVLPSVLWVISSCLYLILMFVAGFKWGLVTSILDLISRFLFVVVTKGAVLQTWSNPVGALLISMPFIAGSFFSMWCLLNSYKISKMGTNIFVLLFGTRVHGNQEKIWPLLTERRAQLALTRPGSFVGSPP